MTDPVVGLVLEGRYRLEERVARGGMSTVYAATDLRLHKTVAVKVMAEHLAHDPTFVDRFTREARAAAMLSHPNVVGVSDQGSDQGLVFLVMELVRGRTLRDLLQARGRLTVAEAFAVLEPVLSGLTAAHRAGIVTNRNAVPADPNGAWYTSGVRIGTPALTTRGFGTAEFDRVAELIAGVLSATTPTTTSAGEPSRAKYTIADGVADSTRAAAGELLAGHPLYPGLDLA